MIKKILRFVGNILKYLGMMFLVAALSHYLLYKSTIMLEAGYFSILIWAIVIGAASYKISESKLIISFFVFLLASMTAMLSVDQYYGSIESNYVPSFGFIAMGYFFVSPILYLLYHYGYKLGNKYFGKTQNK